MRSDFHSRVSAQTIRFGKQVTSRGKRGKYRLFGPVWQKNYLRSIPIGCERGRPCSPRGSPPSRIRDRFAIRIGEPPRRRAPTSDRSWNRRRNMRAVGTSRCNFPAESINHYADTLALMTMMELICLHLQFTWSVLIGHRVWNSRSAYRHLRIIFRQISYTCN